MPSGYWAVCLFVRNEFPLILVASVSVVLSFIKRRPFCARVRQSRFHSAFQGFCEFTNIFEALLYVQSQQFDQDLLCSIRRVVLVQVRAGGCFKRIAAGVSAR